MECLPPTTLASFHWAVGQLVHTGILGKAMWRCSHFDRVVQGRIEETGRVQKGRELGINCVFFGDLCRENLLQGIILIYAKEAFTILLPQMAGWREENLRV